MAKIELRCPECGAMTTWIIDTADMDSVECPECGEKVTPGDAEQALKDNADAWGAFAVLLAGLADSCTV